MLKRLLEFILLFSPLAYLASRMPQLHSANLQLTGSLFLETYLGPVLLTTMVSGILFGCMAKPRLSIIVSLSFLFLYTIGLGTLCLALILETPILATLSSEFILAANLQIGLANFMAFTLIITTCKECWWRLTHRGGVWQ